MIGIAVYCLAYVLSQFYRSFLAVLTPILSNDLSMDPTELALASGAWFVCFALFQFPVGYLLDSYGPRRTAGWIFLLFAGSGIALFAFASSPWMVIIAMGLNGIGCSPALMAPMFIFAHTGSPVKFASNISTFVALGTLGNIAGTEPLALAMDAFGWRFVGISLLASTVLVGVGILTLTADPKRIETEETGGGFLDVLKIRELWPIFPMILTGYVVAGGIRGLWVGPYLEDIYGLGSLEIGRASLFMAISLVLGTFAYGPLDRLFNTRKWVVFFGNGMVLVVCLWLIQGAPNSVSLATIAFVVIGFFGASYAVQMAHGKSYVPSHLTGRGVTLLNFCSIGGAGLFQVISGKVVEANTVVGEPGYAYQALFVCYAIVLAIALFCYSFSRDAKPRNTGN